MSRAAIRAGPIELPGVTVARSGLRWLADEGRRCRRGEVVAFCNLGLFPRAGGPRPFGGEWRDLQVAFAAPAAGRLRRADDVSRGGSLDRLGYVHPWTPDLVLGHLDYADRDAAALPRLLMVAGRRTTELAEVRAGLLTGWHSQARAWWGGDPAAGFSTLLGLGTCEQGGLLRGEGGAFQELFEATEGPAQVVFVPDDVLVPCARVVLEQMRRTEAERGEIAADMLAGFAAGTAPAAGADWLFLGTLLNSLCASPATETFEVLTRQALGRTGPAEAILLSVESELRDVLRHRRLGYTVCCHDFRAREFSPAVSAWFRAGFEPVRRSVADIQADYEALLDAIRARTGARVLVMNKPQTAPFQALVNYAGFARPLGDGLSDVRDQDMNLMLHDLARARGIAVVDVDRIAAELGTQTHIPDRVHHSGALQRETRGEILRALRGFGLGGFGPRDG